MRFFNKDCKTRKCVLRTKQYTEDILDITSIYGSSSPYNILILIISDIFASLNSYNSGFSSNVKVIINHYIRNLINLTPACYSTDHDTLSSELRQSIKSFHNKLVELNKLSIEIRGFTDFQRGCLIDFFIDRYTKKHYAFKIIDFRRVVDKIKKKSQA